MWMCASHFGLRRRCGTRTSASINSSISRRAIRALSRSRPRHCRTSLATYVPPHSHSTYARLTRPQRVRRLEVQVAGLQLQVSVREAEGRVLSAALTERDAALREAITIAEQIYAAKTTNGAS